MGTSTVILDPAVFAKSLLEREAREEAEAKRLAYLREHMVHVYKVVRKFEPNEIVRPLTPTRMCPTCFLGHRHPCLNPDVCSCTLCDG